MFKRLRLRVLCLVNNLPRFNQILYSEHPLSQEPVLSSLQVNRTLLHRYPLLQEPVLSSLLVNRTFLHRTLLHFRLLAVWNLMQEEEEGVSHWAQVVVISLVEKLLKSNIETVKSKRPLFMKMVAFYHLLQAALQ